MNKNLVITIVISILLGAGGTLGVQAIVGNNGQPQESAVVDHSSMSMNDMNKELEGLSGDDYDKAFIEMMIAHHEGAVDMAELSENRAKHDEIKKLSREIIAAQEQEISDMRQWQRDWGYSSDEMMQMMHGNH